MFILDDQLASETVMMHNTYKLESCRTTKPAGFVATGRQVSILQEENQKRSSKFVKLKTTHEQDNHDTRNHHQRRYSPANLNSHNHHHRSTISRAANYSLGTTVILVIIIISTLCIGDYQLSAHQPSLCPKQCICDEHNLETSCKESLGASALPHTLNPNTKRVFINNAQTSLFFGLDYLDKLEILDLAYNKISTIDFVEMSKNGRLISLNTSHNNIIELKDTLATMVFSELGLNPSMLVDGNESIDLKPLKSKLIKINVIDLVLSHNNLTTLRNFTFIRWPKLKLLDLSYNLISNLESHSLFGLNKLETLNLRGNRLTQVPTPALHSSIQSLLSTIYSLQSNSRPSSLKNLDLSENTLVSIGPNSFSMLEGAQELHLESCSIESIHEQAFKGLHTLYLLALDRNNLQEVPHKSFSYLGLLRLLKMNANNFTDLPTGSFSSLVNLEELQMNNGSFSHLQRGVFAGLDSLKRLELSQNPNLTRIDEGTFTDLTRMTYLSLYSNSLSTLLDNFNEEPHALTVLDLRGNPLHCGCDLKWLTKWLKKFNETAQSVQQQANSVTHSFSNQHQGAEETQALLTDPLLTSELLNLTCAGPPALLGKLVAELPGNKLECLKPGSDLNVHIGFATLFLLTFLMTFVCMLNFCRNKRHLFLILKKNLVQNHISMMLPYTQNLHKNVDNLKKETQLYGAEYEPVDYGQQPQVFTIQGDQVMYYEPQYYSQI